MAEAYSRSRKANWLGKKNLESRVRGIFQPDDAPGIGAVQMTSERVARGAGPVQLLVGAHRGANRKRHFSATRQPVNMCMAGASTVRFQRLRKLTVGGGDG